MGITAKPFLKSLKLNKVIFKPRPSLISDQDINLAFDSVSDKVNQAIDLAGGTRVNWALDTIDGIVIDLSTEYAVVSGDITPYKPSSGDAAYLNVNGIQYTAPLAPITLSQSIPIAEWKEAIYVCLIAKKNTTNSPVSSSEFPTNLPGPDVEKWSDERLAWTWKNPSTISLSAGEIMIGIVATYRYQPHWQLDNTTKVPNNLGGGFNFFYNLRDLNTPNEILNSVQVNSGEAIIPRLLNTFQRGSVWETLASYVYAINEIISKLIYTKVSKVEQDKLWATLSENIGDTIAASSALALTATGNYFNVTGDSISSTVSYIKSMEPSSTSGGSLITLCFNGRYGITRNAGSPSTGFKSIKYNAPTRTNGGYNPSTIHFSAGTIVKLREKADAWWIEDIISPDTIFDNLTGLRDWSLSLKSTDGAYFAYDADHLTSNIIFDSIEWSQTQPYSGTNPYDSATGVFTVPKTGIYSIKAVLLLMANQTAGYKALVVQNLTTWDVKVLAWGLSPNIGGGIGELRIPLCGALDFNFTAGETYAFKVFDYTDNGGTFGATFSDTEFLDITGHSAGQTLSSISISYNGYLRQQDY